MEMVRGVNEADKATLTQGVELSSSDANNLIAARKAAGGQFSTVSQIGKATGIDSTELSKLRGSVSTSTLLVRQHDESQQYIGDAGGMDNAIAGVNQLTDGLELQLAGNLGFTSTEASKHYECP